MRAPFATISRPCGPEGGDAVISGGAGAVSAFRTVSFSFNSQPLVNSIWVMTVAEPDRRIDRSEGRLVRHASRFTFAVYARWCLGCW